MSQHHLFKGVCILFSGFLLLSSCASLTKSQLNEVNCFGQSAKTFSAYPEKVISTLVDVHTQSQFYEAAIIENPKIHMESVTAIYKFKQEAAKRDEKIGLVFQIISDYGQKLVHLTADVHTLQLDTAAQSFGTNLDGLIDRFNSADPQHAVPTGYGALISKIVSAGGDLYIQDRQARGAKEFVTKGDTLIGMMALKLEEFLNDNGTNAAKAGIERERKSLAHNYKNYLAADNELITLYYQKDTVYKRDRYRKKDSIAKKDTIITGVLKAWRSSGIGADSLYVKLMENLDADEMLRKQCLDAVKDLRKAHHKLMEDLQEKKNLKEVYAETKAYGQSINQMYSTYKTIK